MSRIHAKGLALLTGWIGVFYWHRVHRSLLHEIIKSAREGGISIVDRKGVIQHTARSRGRHRSAVRAAILVEPGGDLSVPLPETLWWNRDADADGKAPFGDRD